MSWPLVRPAPLTVRVPEALSPVYVYAVDALLYDWLVGPSAGSL